MQAIQRLLPLTGERQRRFIHAENEQFIVDFQVDVTMVSDYCYLFIKEIIMNVKFKLRFFWKLSAWFSDEMSQNWGTGLLLRPRTVKFRGWSF